MSYIVVLCPPKMQSTCSKWLFTLLMPRTPNRPILFVHIFSFPRMLSMNYFQESSKEYIYTFQFKVFTNLFAKCGGPFSQLGAGLPPTTLWPNGSG